MKLLSNHLLLLTVYFHRQAGVFGQIPNPQKFLDLNLSQVRVDFDGLDPDPPDDCGVSCRAPDPYAFGLLACLRDAFENDAGEMPPVTLDDKGELVLPKVVFSPATSFENTDFNLTNYNIARSASVPSRLPAAVLYAEDADEVQKGINCARVNGYKVSPRGRNHDFSSVSTLDGTLVIDVQLNCEMDSFVADKSVSGNHILPDSRYIGTMTVPSGCTNAVLLAAVYEEFGDAAGICVIGSCPAVGVTGFLLNGGLGDATPYAGLGSDVVDEIKMVLYNGEKITASATENEDIFWASKGGTGGIGVITEFKIRIVENPNGKKFTGLTYITDDFQSSEAQAEFFMKFQDFLFDNPDSTLYGGDFSSPFGNSFMMNGLFLGSVEDLINVFSHAGLLDEEFVRTESSDIIFPSFAQRNYTPICGPPPCNDTKSNGGIDERFPPVGMFLSEFETQAEAQAYITCRTWFNGDLSVTVGARSLLNDTKTSTGSLCDDLGISKLFCTPESFGWDKLNSGSCFQSEVIQSILLAASNPKGFLNRRGLAIVDRDFAESSIPIWPDYRRNSMALGLAFNTRDGTATGGLMLPRLQQATVENLLTTSPTQLHCNHLAHGAPLKVPPESTGYPHRNAACNTPTNSRSTDFVNALLQDPAYNNDPINLQIYANYNPSLAIPNYGRHVFVDNLEKLARIRSERDPLGGFDSPRYPQRKNLRRTVPLQAKKHKNDKKTKKPKASK